MKNLGKWTMHWFIFVCIVVLITASLAGCAGNNASKSTGGNNTTSNTGNTDTAAVDKAKEQKPFKITIMSQSFDADPAPADSPVIKALEEYTGVDVDITWVPSTSYNDKLNTTLASGDLPMVVLALSKSASIISACRAGAFWELGPYLKDYPNLSKANKVVLYNSSIDGKTYGIYRGRDLGRNGIIYRKDWLDNVGLDVPKTINDFYNMLKAFTYDDPDKNGKQDTYGMAVANYNGPFKIMLTWFGAPNEWGDDGSGQLVPAFTTNEYMECLKFWKKLYDEKLINQDFAALDPNKWNDAIYAGKAGVKVDVLDDAGRWEDNFKKAGVNAVVDVIGAVAGPKGLRNLPTSGYAGMYLVSKTGVKTEDDLKKVLAFLDKLGDKQMQDLLGWGIKDRHYKLVNNEIDPIPNLPADIAREVHGTNQLLMFIPPENATPRTQSDLRKRASQLMKENVNIVVPNPAEPFVSQTDTYAKKGAQLDNIIEDARVKFIAGQIDEKGFQNAIEQWRNTGGNDLIREVNELYQKYKDSMPVMDTSGSNTTISQ